MGHPSLAPVTPGASLATTLNIGGEEGIAATVLDCIVNHRMALDGSKRAYNKRKREEEDAAKSIKEAKKLTPGVMNKHDIFSLDDPRLLQTEGGKVGKGSEGVCR